jgi:hypothetical protein
MSPDLEAAGPEIIIGLVTPVGTNTGDVAEALRGSLSVCGYRSHIIKVSDFFNKQNPGPPGENDDERVRRLIKAGDDWCTQNNDAAAVVGIVVNEIRSIRAQHHWIAGLGNADGSPIPRTAYIIHSRESIFLRRAHQELGWAFLERRRG